MSIFMQHTLWYLAENCIEVITKKLALSRINLLVKNWYAQECPTSMNQHNLSVLHNNCGHKAILSTQLKFIYSLVSSFVNVGIKPKRIQLRSPLPRNSKSLSFVPSMFMKNQRTIDACATVYLHYVNCHQLSACHKILTEYAYFPRGNNMMHSLLHINLQVFYQFLQLVYE